MNTPQTEAPPKIVARVDRRKLYFMLVAAVCAYGAAFFLASRFELVVMGVALAVGLAYGVKELLTNKTKIVVDKHGVLDTRLGMGTIGWQDIERVYVTRGKKQHWDYICLDVVDAKKYLDRRNAAARASIKFNAAYNKMSPFNINTGVLDVRTDELYEAIVHSANYYTQPETNTEQRI